MGKKQEAQKYSKKAILEIQQKACIPWRKRSIFSFMQKSLTEYLLDFVTAERREKMMAVLEERTRYCTVVLEDIYQPHNASAVLRSCDGFGIQDVHIIENRNHFRVNSGIELGTSRWLNIHRQRSVDGGSAERLDALKKQGYRIVVTSPHADDIDLEEFDLNKGKTAFVFGNEKDGISQEALSAADEYLKIPMRGFVESFNISVSCAVLLHHISWKLRQMPTEQWSLSDSDREEILLSWLRKTVKHANRLEKAFKLAEKQASSHNTP